MKSMTVRDIDEDLYGVLVRLATENRRSLQQQVLLILEAEAATHRIGLVGRAQAWRDRLRDRDVGDVVKDVRELRAI